MKSLYSIIGTLFSVLLSLPLFALLASDCCNPCDLDSNCSWAIKGEARVAYYHPTSHKVRKIYGDGWADYQIELSKAFTGFGRGCGDFGCCGLDELECDLWVGVSGFSQKGESIGFHDDTKLQLVPINVGVKFFYPIFCDMKIFIGGAACYSFLRIHDDSEYVHEHTRKGAWGGLFQSGINYNFCEWAYVSAFFDYYFQRFHFHNSKGHVSSQSSYHSQSYNVERHNLNMNGYKVGVGLGVTF